MTGETKDEVVAHEVETVHTVVYMILTAIKTLDYKMAWRFIHLLLQILTRLL